MEGFSFNGVHSSSFPCWYIPSESDKMLSTPDYEVLEADVTGRDGGYYYGNRIKTREFSLPCFFEDITLETKERMFQWLDRCANGKQVFDNRPFVHYHVRPVKRITGKIYTSRHDGANEDTYSGTFTIVFKAYDPFGYMTYNTYSGIDMDGAGRYCGILEESEMPPLPSVSDTSVLIYNCGTQPCDTIIKIGGTAADGLSITNRANGQVCSVTSQPNIGYLEINSLYGSVEHVNGTTRELVFEFHDDGFIQLEPYGRLIDNVQVSFTKSSNQISISNTEISDELIGKYVFQSGEWIRIIAVLSNGMIVQAKSMNADGACMTKITSMNEIDIEGNNVSLNKLEIEYTPRVY